MISPTIFSHLSSSLADGVIAARVAALRFLHNLASFIGWIRAWENFVFDQSAHLLTLEGFEGFDQLECTMTSRQ